MLSIKQASLILLIVCVAFYPAAAFYEVDHLKYFATYKTCQACMDGQKEVLDGFLLYWRVLDNPKFYGCVDIVRTNQLASSHGFFNNCNDGQVLGKTNQYPSEDSHDCGECKKKSLFKALSGSRWCVSEVDDFRTCVDNSTSTDPMVIYCRTSPASLITECDKVAVEQRKEATMPKWGPCANCVARGDEFKWCILKMKQGEDFVLSPDTLRDCVDTSKDNEIAKLCKNPDKRQLVTLWTSDPSCMTIRKLKENTYNGASSDCDRCTMARKTNPNLKFCILGNGSSHCIDEVDNADGSSVVECKDRGVIRTTCRQSCKGCTEDGNRWCRKAEKGESGCIRKDSQACDGGGLITDVDSCPIKLPTCETCLGAGHRWCKGKDGSNTCTDSGADCPDKDEMPFEAVDGCPGRSTPAPTATPKATPAALPTKLPTGLSTKLPTGLSTKLPTGLSTAPPTALPTALPMAAPSPMSRWGPCIAILLPGFVSCLHGW